MPPPRSAAIAVRSVTATGDTLLYTVSAGITVLIKQVNLVNDAAVTNTIRVYAFRPSGGYAEFTRKAMATNEVLQADSGLVMDPGDQLWINQSATACRIWVSGTVLQGTATP